MLGTVPFVFMARPWFWKFFAICAYAGSVVLLIAVLVMGTVFGGANRWIAIGPITIQPSEIAKMALIMFLSLFMAKQKMYQRPDGLYEKGMTINGKRIRFRGKTEREVLQKIASYEEKQENGLTFEEIAEQWRNEYSKDVEYYSYVKSKAAYNSAKDYFGDMYIKDITPQDISRYYAFLGAKGYAKKTVNNYKAIVSNVFKYAIENGHSDNNPTTLVSVPKKYFTPNSN